MTEKRLLVYSGGEIINKQMNKRPGGFISIFAPLPSSNFIPPWRSRRNKGESLMAAT